MWLIWYLCLDGHVHRIGTNNPVAAVQVIEAHGHTITKILWEES